MYKQFNKHNKQEKIILRITLPPVEKIIIEAVVVGATLVVANFIGEHVCIFGGNVAFFMDKMFNPQPEIKTKKLTN